MNFKRFVSSSRWLNPEELYEWQEINRLVAAEKFKEVAMKQNTALIPKGQALLEQQVAIVEALEKTKRDYIGVVLGKIGCKPDEKVTINMKTGEVCSIQN